MVNNNSSIPGGSIAGAAGSGSNAAGGGSQSTPPSGAIPATVVPKYDFRGEVTTLVDAIGKKIPGAPTFVVAGQSITKQGLEDFLNGILALFEEVDTGAQALKQRRLALQAALPGAHQFVVNLKAVLVGLFGKGNPVLESFGIAPKRRQLTTEQKLARQEKAKLTREQRGTGGKRQLALKKFTGQVVVQTAVAPSGATIVGPTAPAAGGDTGASSSTPSQK